MKVVVDEGVPKMLVAALREVGVDVDKCSRGRRPRQTAGLDAAGYSRPTISRRREFWPHALFGSP